MTVVVSGIDERYMYACKTNPGEIIIKLLMLFHIIIWEHIKTKFWKHFKTEILKRSVKIYTENNVLITQNSLEKN